MFFVIFFEFYMSQYAYGKNFTLLPNRPQWSTLTFTVSS